MSPPTAATSYAAPAWVQKSWSDFVARQLLRLKINRRELARRAGVDPSYVTLWLRGYVPHRKQVERLGQAVDQLHAARQAAGLISTSTLDLSGLSDETLNLVERLRTMTPDDQDAVTAQLRAYLSQTKAPFFGPEVENF